MTTNRKYRGKLTIDQIAEGIDLALENAQDLSEEARMLFDRRHYGRALALSYSAMEEIGKIHVLKAMVRIPPKNQKLWREQWGNFRRHERKTAHGRVNLAFDGMRGTPSLMLGVALNEAVRAADTESIRQRALYTDFGEKGWESPRDTPEESALESIEDAEQALDRIQILKSHGLLSQAALRVEHEVLAPVNLRRPGETELTPAFINEVKGQLPAKMREYCRRLVEEGVLSADADIEMMGVPLQVIVADED